MKMESVFVLKYIDALYFKQGEGLNGFGGFREHIAIGKVFKNDVMISGELTLSFAQKDNKPFSGLRLPKEALILSGNHNSGVFKNLYKKNELEKGNKIGVYWKDITYFTNGQEPSVCTKMYTEGLVNLSTEESLLIEKPKTIKVREEKILSEHPDQITDITLCAIPWALITGIEKYG